jgi:hypothetical protein
MIRAIIGGTGGGKSLLATRYITESLCQTNALVVTNVPLVMGEIHQYVSKHRQADLPPFDMDNDVKVLPDEEVLEFYRYRSGGLILPPSPDMADGDDGTKRLPKQEFITRMKENFSLLKGSPDYQRPVHYYMDEAHNFFGSRDWKSNGRALLYYASQHRHLHDEIYLITQVIDDVEKQFRDRVLESHRTTNMLRMRVGMFRAKPCFRVEVFNTLPGGHKQPQYVKDYSALELDINGIAKCYKTVGALGIHSSPEAKTNKAPFPQWLLWVVGGLAVLAVAACIFGLPYIGSYMGKSVVRGALGGIGGMPTTKTTHTPVSSGADTPAEDTPTGVPALIALWVEVVDGAPRIHAMVEGATNEIPPRWIEAYNMEDYPAAWVRAKGVTYYLRASKIRPQAAPAPVPITPEPEPKTAVSYSKS